MHQKEFGHSGQDGVMNAVISILISTSSMARESVCAIVSIATKSNATERLISTCAAMGKIKTHKLIMELDIKTIL